jgi:7-cyano-7-deazaguanine reductase
MPEKRIDLGKLTILGRKTSYPDSPEKAKLETFKNEYPGRDYWITFHCPEFTSLCPKTNQPDFGVIKIRYIPQKKCLEAKSLKLYLFSYRNIGVFNEHTVNRILDDIVKSCKPRRAEVTGEFNPRGGINITVEATYQK